VRGRRAHWAQCLAQQKQRLPSSPHASTVPTATAAGLLEYLEDIIGSGVYVERIAEAEKVTEALSAQVRALRGAATGVLKEGHGLLRSVVGQ
jgi:hypothetical protein